MGLLITDGIEGNPRQFNNSGTWLEKAVAELAMDAASNGRTEISDGKIAELLQKAGLMDATELDRIKGTKSGE